MNERHFPSAEHCIEDVMFQSHMVNTDEAVVHAQIRKAVPGEPKCGPYTDVLGTRGKMMDISVDVWLLVQEMTMVLLMPNGWGMNRELPSVQLRGQNGSCLESGVFFKRFQNF